MTDREGRTPLDAGYAVGGKPLRVTELRDGWRVSYEGKEVEHRHLDHALAGAFGRPPGSLLDLVQRILTAPPGADLAS